MANSGELGLYLVLLTLGGVLLVSLVLGAIMWALSGTLWAGVAGALFPWAALWLWWNR